MHLLREGYWSNLFADGVISMTRTFIALELDTSQQHFRGNLIRQGKEALPELRWVNPVGIHLTVAFLGELSDQQLAKASLAAQSAAATVDPFLYRFSGLGTFGSPHQPRVLWMGISESSGVLIHVYQILTLALEQQGFTTEKRPFSPHLTLARMKSPLRSEQFQLLQQLLSYNTDASPAYRATHLCVMKSEFAHSGAHYTCLQICPLKKLMPKEEK